MNLRNLLLALLSVLFVSESYSQVVPKDPDEILIKEELPRVLLVGSFHFAYYGLDAYKTSEDDKVNIMSEKRQKEVEELVDYIARFKPTKLVIECNKNNNKYMKKYREYQKDKKNIGADEVEQICYRLMEKLDIDTLYNANAWGMNVSMYMGKDSTMFRPWLEEMYKDWDFKSDDKVDKRYDELYSYGDKLAKKLTLLEFFKYKNSEKMIKRGHGAYLVGDFKLGEYRGADALALHWYARNLRIFRNIQNITTSPDDRIMVLFGAGHMSILRQLFESTPEYELVPFNELE